MAELAEFTGSDNAKQTTAKQIVDYETAMREVRSTELDPENETVG
jgi:hypothetical protein